VIDEAALIRALARRRIAAAGLDVFEHEPEVPAALRALPNVVLTPHVGSATTATRTAMAMLAVENLVTALAGHEPPNHVRAPAKARVAAGRPSG